MTLEELPGWAAEMLAAERVARLAFLDEQDLPRVLPVTFAVWEGAVWSAIDRKPKRTAEPARVRRLRRRPEAALLVDRYDDDWSRLAWVELRGSVSIEPAGPALEALAARYEQYRAEPPPGPLLRLEVERAAWWRAVDRRDR
jgi:PPOX class probable F420-dependent enzyme